MAKKGLSMEVRAERVRKLVSEMDNLNMEAIHEDLGHEGVAIVEDRFDKSTDAFGFPFKPIKPYIYRSGGYKVRRLAGHPPLKGGLGAPPLARSMNFEASARHALVGSPVSYAKYHTDAPDNNQRPRKMIPRREFMGYFLDRDTARLVGVVEDHVETLLQGI